MKRKLQKNLQSGLPCHSGRYLPRKTGKPEKDPRGELFKLPFFAAILREKRKGTFQEKKQGL